MRHVRNHLGEFLEPDPGDFIQKQSKYNRTREGCQAQKRDGQRVGDHLPEGRVLEETNEIIQSDPSAVENTL